MPSGLMQMPCMKAYSGTMHISFSNKPGLIIALIGLMTLYCFVELSMTGIHMLVLAVVCGAAVVDGVLDVEIDVNCEKMRAFLLL